jgi:TonB family protein
MRIPLKWVLAAIALALSIAGCYFVWRSACEPPPALEPPRLIAASSTAAPQSKKIPQVPIISTETDMCCEEPKEMKEELSADPCPSGLKLLLQRKPEYPPAAVALRIEGEVVLKVFVSRDGSIKRAVIIKSSNEMLSYAAHDCVMKWRYSPPATVSPKFSVCSHLVTVNFQLSSDSENNLNKGNK